MILNDRKSWKSICLAMDSEPTFFIKPPEPPTRLQKVKSIINHCMQIDIEIPIEFISEYNKEVKKEK